MTLENSKRLYELFLARGMTKEAEDLLSKRPELKPKEEAPKKSSKKAKK
jgi:hypothetical protein